MIAHLRRRWNTMRSFAAAGEGWVDRLLLVAAGFARHRPFGGNSPYGRLGRFLAHRVTPRVALAGGQRLQLDLSSLVDLMIFEEIYVEHTYPVERVPFEPDLVIDCGACSGMFALLARARFPVARVVALEPEPGNFERLRRNIDLNQARIEAFRLAAGLQRGSVSFAGEGFGGHLADAAEPGAITVDMISLPELLAEFRPERLVLKMDIEGAEREILPAIAHLLPPQTVIFLETHHEESVCATYLQPCLDAGFRHELVRHRLEPGHVSIYVERLLIRDEPPVRHFCTYFDHNYASLGLALYESLRRHAPAFCLWILCLDDEAHALLTRLALPGVRLIGLAEFERDDPALLAAKPGRSLIEYYFTCTPSLPRHILRRDPDIGLITYLDADLCFYSSPERIFTEIGTASVAIIDHRFSARLGHLVENGIYNVGWLTFRRDADGLQCLDWWRERCLEWCFIRHEPGRYADQKYLDDWPRRFRNVKVLAQKGANLAMWNLDNHTVTRHGRKMFVDGDPLVFFHFHGLRRPQQWIFSMGAPYYEVFPSRTVLRHVFAPYVAALVRIESTHRLAPERGSRLVPDHGQRGAGTFFSRLRFAAHLLFNILNRNYLIVRRGHIIMAP